MQVRTATSVAFAAACLAAAAAMPAQAQPAGTYGAGTYGNGPHTYQGGAAPQWSGNPPGSPNWSANNPGPQPYQGNAVPSAAGAGGTEVVTNGPQTDPGDMSPSWSARQNVEQSQRYDRMLESNRGFRQARMRTECGPITDQELRQQCLASFGQNEPSAGSSTSHRNYRSESGR
jgi:hypothetical protein